MENTLLNLIPSSYIPEVHLSQYDVGRELTFKLMDGNTEYSVPSGATITVKATKPSGLGFVVSGTFSGNIVTIVNTETMTNESGRFSAELSISSGATLLGTSNFIFNIERSPHPEGTTDGDAETLIPELTLLVNEIRESNAKVESMTASASPLPSGSNPTAEYDPDTNNLAFGIPTSEVTTEDLYKAFITKSANGSIASFSDGGDDLPMKSLLVNIVPKQSGSGDPSPSNVRPISGWDSVDVYISPTTSEEDGQTITTNLPQTVYGGTLDVVSGVLNITHKLVTFNGSESWGFSAGSGKNRVNLSIADAKRGTYSIDIWGNYIKATSEAMSMPNEWQGNINNLGALLLGVPTSITSADSWESYLANNPLTIVYPLATTTELTLTPTEVKTLLGSNNIWSESGTVEVEYRADTTLAYEELANAIISLGGNI